MKTFKCNFGNGVICELETPDEAPSDGRHFRFQWTGEPHPGLTRAYIAWMSSVNKLLADEWKVSFLHIFLTAPGKQETWAYTPGEPPKMISRDPGS